MYNGILKEQGESFHVSVIIPVYNTSIYLPRLFNALEKQTFQKFECIFIDDGSDDNSRMLIDAYKQQTSRCITVIEQRHQGAAAARNAGIKQSTGDAITFIDSDDYITADYLQEMISSLQRTKADVAIMGVQAVKNDVVVKKDCESASEELLLNSQEYARKVLRKEDAAYIVANKMIRRTESLPVFPENVMFEDMYYSSALAWKPRMFCFIPKQLYVYCKNSSSVSNTVSEKQIGDYFKVCQWIIEGYEDAGMTKHLKEELLSFIAYAGNRINRKYNELNHIISNQYYQDIIKQLSELSQKVENVNA